MTGIVPIRRKIETIYQSQRKQLLMTGIVPIGRKTPNDLSITKKRFVK